MNKPEWVSLLVDAFDAPVVANPNDAPAQSMNLLDARTIQYDVRRSSYQHSFLWSQRKNGPREGLPQTVFVEFAEWKLTDVQASALFGRFMHDVKR